MTAKETRLKVMEALQEEAYKGIVRIDSETMREIGVRPGDIVEIEGNRKTVGIVDRAYPTDVGQAIIRMDGILRRNGKTGIGENVVVRKCDVKEAKSVTIAPAQEGVMIQGHPDVFRRGLLGRAVVRGDIVALGGAQRRRKTLTGSPFEDIFDVFEQGFMGTLGFSGLKFIVAGTAPKDSPVIITETTEISVSSKAMEVTEERVPEVTYEDIGGLEDEIKKVREMVELPLKHPEIFERLGIEPPKGVLFHGPPGTGKTLLAKAVANESDANFLLINGPEVTSKFYGECVTGESLILTNGLGLSTIEEAIKEGKSHKIAGLNMQSQKLELLPISDSYDKGVMKTFKIITPHGFLELTPTSKLLVLRDVEPEWVMVKDLKIGDKVAMSNSLPEIEESIPSILEFIGDKVKFSGEWVRELFNQNGKTKDVAKILNIEAKKVQDMKYNCSSPAWVIKKLYKPDFIEKLKLTGKGSIPTKITKDLMYLLGLLSGDGHLRYNYKDNHVSTITFTNIDQNVINEYKRIIKDTFGIDDIQYDGKYGYWFSSSPIGNLLRNLGIPAKDKAHTLKVPQYLISMPKEYISAYLKGLFDTDGHVHLVPSGMQISYYTASKQMLNGVKFLLLRLGIQSTFRARKDGTYELTINDRDSIELFKKNINFNHKNRRENLEKELATKYTKPVLNRIPLRKFLNNLKEKYNMPKDKLVKLGLNPYVNSYTRKQVDALISLLEKLNEDSLTIDKIKILRDNDLIWSPIRMISESENHVYDFTVPNDHNFIANGFIVHNSEKRIRDIFEEAEKNAPSIIFIDEIDAIAPKREETYGEVERRMVAQLLATMDGMKGRGKVIVIGATNRPNSLDPALRRPGRFDREITIGVPNKAGRLTVLKIHTRNMPLTKDVDIDHLASVTHGFVGADLSALCKEAAMSVLRRVLPDLKLKENTSIPREALEKLRVTANDFKDALKVVRPSAMREVLIENPNVKWEDVGGLVSLKQDLIEAVEWPLKNPTAFKRLGIRPPRGILIYGPPGTGKTLLAKAVATESEANFIYIKGPELISKWVGESLPYNEELIVKKDGLIQRMKIGDIVENKQDVEILAFDKDKRVIFSKIDDYIKHPLTSNLLEITTKTGRKIKVTSDHSLFSFVNGQLASMPANYLIPNESYIAIPKRLNLPRDIIKRINLYDHFKSDESIFVGNVKDYLTKSKKILGLDKTAKILAMSKKYLSDIIGKNLPVPIFNFDKLVKEAKLAVDPKEITIKLKGSTHSYPVLFNLDADFWRLVGLWIAEGDLNGYTVRIHNQNPDIRNDMQRICKKYNFSVSDGKKAITINSMLMKKIFKNVLGLKTGARNKRIPALVFILDKQSKSNFLKGYFSGDGSIYQAERGKFQIEAGTISKELANDLLYILLDFGIVASLYTKLEITGSTTYRISILGVKNFESFREIGFIDKIRDNRIKQYIESRKWFRSELIPLSGELYEIASQNTTIGDYAIGKERLRNILILVDKDKSKYKDYWDLVEGDIFFDLVKEIKLIGNEEYVYDVSVPDGQNFVAGFGGVFAHNSEKAIRKVFEKARQASPAIIFFDEIDSIASKRGTEIGTKSTERVLNQLLTEMDGLEELTDVVVIAATNRPDLVDSALLRPGRFDRIIPTKIPGKEDRIAIFKVHTKNMPLAKDVKIEELASQTENYSGADMESLCREAAIISLREDIETKQVKMKHFEKALARVKSSLTDKEIQKYHEIEESYLKRARAPVIRTPTYMG